MFNFEDCHPARSTCAVSAGDIHSTIAHLKSEIAQFAIGVDRVRGLVKALKAAACAELEGSDEELYWPHLLEVLEGAIPGGEGVERAVRGLEW